MTSTFTRTPVTRTPASTTMPAAAPTSDRLAASRAALKDLSPLLVALMPFSIAIGAAAQTNGLSGLELMAGATFLLAGASQLAAIELIGAGTSAAVIVATTLAINLRFVLYSAGLARWFERAPLRNRLAMAATVVDQNFMICAGRFTASGESETADDPDEVVAWRSRYFVTASAALITVFFSCQIVGYQLGAALPAELGLHMAVPLAFSGLLAKMAATGSSRVASLVAAAVVLVLVGLPAGTGLPVAAIVGVAVGSIPGSTFFNRTNQETQS